MYDNYNNYNYYPQSNSNQNYYNPNNPNYQNPSPQEKQHPQMNTQFGYEYFPNISDIKNENQKNEINDFGISKINPLSNQMASIQVERPQIDPAYKRYEFQENFEKQKIGESLGLPGKVYIHKHLLKYSELTNTRCNACNQSTTQNFYFCEKCKLYLCGNCSNILFNNPQKNVNCHNHPLTLGIRSNIKCDICRKDYSNHASFFCIACDFDCCFNCYNNFKLEIKKDNRGNETYYHKHLIIKNLNCKKNKCDSCGGDFRKKVYSCNYCDIDLCENCHKMMIQNKNKYKIHAHPLIMDKEKEFVCESCGREIKNKVGFNCKLCKVILCSPCYLYSY